ncbi:hypothetical protein KOI35_32730 [Actinoplanes bogorensis]|uniref:Uncharacterized protein n=1 Tax=Paractinoplanes bogorensis TaxID=1610840 RepID=A0ABS5YY24_9ACTN|nr:hypothetical protein [Actinoplanes bogorensis]MBU2668288.1 hypothetical protein [Actinoplanes bogorensis]
MSETTQLERHEPGLHVFAEFSGDEDAPKRLVVEAPRVTRETLRRVARHLGDMAVEYAGPVLAVGARQVMIARYTEDQVATLPADGTAFHRGLLDIRDDLAARGVDNSEQVLARAMRVPEETLVACLRVARERLAQ